MVPTTIILSTLSLSPAYRCREPSAEIKKEQKLKSELNGLEISHACCRCLVTSRVGLPKMVILKLKLSYGVDVNRQSSFANSQ